MIHHITSSPSTKYNMMLLLRRRKIQTDTITKCFISSTTATPSPPLHRRYFVTTSSTEPSRDNKNDVGGGGHGDGNDGMVLFDSLSKTFKTIFKKTSPSSEDEDIKGFAWYTCGPTVYDAAHLGHARTYVCFDIIHRLILHQYHSLSSSQSQRQRPPIFIMNITDVDDKILKKAKEKNMDPIELARFQEREFFKDLEELNVMSPTIITRVSEHVESDIVPYVEKILGKGMAYVVHDEDEGGVYFDVQAFEIAKNHKYGKLSPLSSSSSPSVEEVEEEEDNNKNMTKTKRDTRDFALWKFRKPHEDLYWPSPWGDGRPGWHIECSAMIEAIVSNPLMKKMGYRELNVHAGGIDLKFPHHTNEIAQAEAYHHHHDHSEAENVCCGNNEWVDHWVHTGHLHIQGQKMSKSLKNFITIRELLQPSSSTLPSSLSSLSESSLSSSSSLSSFDFAESKSDDFRLWCLGYSGSYRKNAIYSKQSIENCGRIRQNQIVRVLYESDKFLYNNDNTTSSATGDKSRKKWSTYEIRFFESILQHSENCMNALMGQKQQQQFNSSSSCDDLDNDNNTNNSNFSKSEFDLDGSLFVKELLKICHITDQHLQQSNNNDKPMILEPLRFSVLKIRDLLGLVGFTKKTTHPYSYYYNNNINSANDGNLNEIQWQQQKDILIDYLVNFRKSVRTYALEGIQKVNRQKKDKSGNDMNNTDDKKKDWMSILNACDEMRDLDLPSMGIELFDGKHQSSSNLLKENASSSLSSFSNNSYDRDWRYCSPRVPENRQEEENSKKEEKTRIMKSVTLETLFQVGEYKDLFSEYYTASDCVSDDDPTIQIGFPKTMKADGKPLSKNLKKKLLKKRQKFLDKQEKQKIIRK